MSELYDKSTIEAVSDSRTREEIYDQEIAPVLLKLGEKLKQLDMSMVAVVEYAPGERGDTFVMGKDSGIEMQFLTLCAQTVPNIDSFILNVQRWCKRNNVSTDSSMILRGL